MRLRHKPEGIITDQDNPQTFRVVKVHDEVIDKTLYLLTTQMSGTANTISSQYNARWDVEVLFKHLK
jgi:IS4 transposase